MKDLLLFIYEMMMIIFVLAVSMLLAVLIPGIVNTLVIGCLGIVGLFAVCIIHGVVMLNGGIRRERLEKGI